MGRLDNLFVFILLRVSLLLTVFLMGCKSSIEHVKCPGFDFNLIGVDKYYFEKSLYYSNGIDTIRLECVDLEYSDPKEFYRGNGYVQQCCPSLNISYRDSLNENLIYFCFRSPNEYSKKMFLSIQINLKSEKICLDSIDRFGLSSISIEDSFESRERSPTELSHAESFELENYRVTCIEISNGERWDLVRLE